MTQPQSESSLVPFDRRVLMRQSMNDKALADEVLGLFLQQLNVLAGKDWGKLDLNFEMHSLKGSAASVGAVALEALSHDWRGVGPDLQNRILQAIVDFKTAAK